MGWGAVDHRIGNLERQRARSGATPNQDGYAFTLHATCPPSTSVYYRGGYSWQVIGYLVEYGWYVPSYTVDLTDSEKVSVRPGYGGYTHIFTNAYWYAPCLFLVSNTMTPPEPPDEWPAEIEDHSIYLYGRIGWTGVPPYLTEYETAAEAESAFLEIIGDAVTSRGTICGGIILRNNGNTSSPNQYQAVDPVNRGRSYLFGAKRYGWYMG